ncbi:hypothetical protein HBH51_102720 [Parastagonospora nodorum]|nr:hypothetical protein HBH51_102720 [Parastagonospora nodorum]
MVANMLCLQPTLPHNQTQHHAMPLHKRFHHLGIARIATNQQRTPPSRCNIHILSSSILLNNTFRAFLKPRSRPSSAATRFPPLPNCMQLLGAAIGASIVGSAVIAVDPALARREAALAENKSTPRYITTCTMR